MDTSARLKRIQDKMELLLEKKEDWIEEAKVKEELIWEKPISLQEVTEFEAKHNIKLPEDYKEFITTIASAGSMLFYGLYCLNKDIPSYEECPSASKPFPFSVEKDLRIFELSEEEYDEMMEREDLDDGFLLLCTEGCGMNNILIVNTEDKATYGTVWFYDMFNDVGIMPILHPESKKPMKFLDWFEYWLDQELDDDREYFSYMELLEFEDEESL